jgi:alanyl-tRNA synthetase
LTSDEIRQSFLNFFKNKGHTIVPSAPVIPQDDPTLLFTNAGMNQFKDVFLGRGSRSYSRAADTQKCIRVSGKHNDLEEVGRDTYHHTFFEMLGNWSFGDYYKKEAIEWAWELLTKVWGLDKRRLYATVFETDDEAAELWKTAVDIDPAHVLRFGKKDNFWEMGETGPCGPCSEIHIDLTEDLSGEKLVNLGDPRVMEIWNLVFIQYDRNASGNLTPLPAKHVDTGMGFERICAVLQKKNSNYDTDVFTPIIERISALVHKPYNATLDSPIDIAMRVIADHVRMLTFSIADGGIPSNEGRGYVMRRILRRAARFGRNLDMHEPFIYKIVHAVVDSMGKQFVEITQRQSYIERVVRGEEESFNATLDRGLEIFESVVKRIGSSRVFPGEEAFKLYDTYGFPLDLTELMARERGVNVEIARFNELMEEQRKRSRKGRVVEYTYASERNQAGEFRPRPSEISLANSEITSMKAPASRFIGYDTAEVKAVVLSREDRFIVLDRTPFYGESGGQVGDTGEITLGSTTIRVVDTKKIDQANVHLVEEEVRLSRGDEVKARIDIVRRNNIERNHTATHIVHEALRRVLGSHAHQQGSLVAPDHLRFDFNHFERISRDQLKEIELIVNEKIAENIQVVALNDPKDWLTIEEAKKRYPNIKMFFGDKYGEKVRVVEIDPEFSVELCGGTHVKQTRDIGPFKIVSESSIASGIRRIEAVTGEGLQQYIERRLKKIGELNEHLAKLAEEKELLEKELGTQVSTKTLSLTPPEAISLPEQVDAKSFDVVESAEKEWTSSIETLTKQTTDLKKELSKLRIQQASSSVDDLVSGGVEINGFRIVSARVDAQTMDELKSIGDTLRKKIQSGVGILASVVDNKVALVCVVTDDLIKGRNLQAGKIVGEVAKGVGGSGGGRPHLATAGGKEVEKLDETLRNIPRIIQSMLGK